MIDAEIFDVDGTLCDVRAVRHHVMEKPKNFYLFHNGAISCPPHKQATDGVGSAVANGRKVLVVTARKEMWRRQTEFWLAMHDIPSDALYMRADHDNRSDVDVKRDILTRIRKRFNVVKAWDDNPSVVALWESEGIETVVIPGWSV